MHVHVDVPYDENTKTSNPTRETDNLLTLRQKQNRKMTFYDVNVGRINVFNQTPFSAELSFSFDSFLNSRPADISMDQRFRKQEADRTDRRVFICSIKIKAQKPHSKSVKANRKQFLIHPIRSIILHITDINVLILTNVYMV